MTMIWKVKERSRIRTIQTDNLRSFLGIRRMDEAPNARIRELWGVMCRVTKGVEERIDEGVLLWFDHVDRMENDRIAEKV